jgi:hypothetical protein
MPAWTSWLLSFLNIFYPFGVSSVSSNSCFLLLTFLFSVFSHPNNYSIPWDEIKDQPEKFYDVEQFKLPTLLKPLDMLKSSPLSVYSLLEFFMSASNCSNPFCFISEEIIQDPTGQSPSFVDDTDESGNARGSITNVSSKLTSTLRLHQVILCFFFVSYL